MENKRKGKSVKLSDPDQCRKKDPRKRGVFEYNEPQDHLISSDAIIWGVDHMTGT